MLGGVAPRGIEGRYWNGLATCRLSVRKYLGSLRGSASLRGPHKPYSSVRLLSFIRI